MEFPHLPPGTNVVGVGIDQIEVSRIRDSIARHGDSFLAKVFTEKERDLCMQRTDPAPCFAARFASKEAASKALGIGIGQEFGWLDLEVQRQESGQPLAVFSPRMKPILDKRMATSVLISVSHLQEVASAIVVLIK